ncbi:MAG: nitrogen regulation protein NR(II) [Planctomycetota bacterium]
MAKAPSDCAGAFPAALCRDVLEALDLGVALLDPEGRVLYANGPLRDHRPGGPEAPEGRDLLEAFPTLSLDFDWERALQQAVKRGRTIRVARQQAGSGRSLDIALAPVRTARGVRSALLTVEDVSDAVRLEARLLTQARTRALANLGESVAHEIRNPLNSIHMNVQLLREGLTADDVDRGPLDRTAQVIQREIRRLDRVVQDFVQYSKPAARVREPGSVNRLVRAAVDALDGQIRERRLQVEIDLRSARPVAMDADRLQRAFYNVLLNAVQVLPPGGRIVCRSRDEEHYCLLEISDNGPGMDLLKQAHLFDLFYTTKEGGTGLGLAIANRIIEEHGGRMAVASEPGRGATFAFFMPFEGGQVTTDGGPTAVPVHPDQM